MTRAARTFSIIALGLVAAMIIFIETHRVEDPAKRGRQIGEVAVAERLAADRENLRWLGSDAVEAGLATDYTVSAVHGRLDLTISSLSPADARRVTDTLCAAARNRFAWEGSYDVRVFLPTGDRPAAACRI